MNPTELRQLDSEGLKQHIADARQELFNMRFQLAAGKTVNTSRFRQLRKDIARVQTIMRERQQVQE